MRCHLFLMSLVLAGTVFVPEAASAQRLSAPAAIDQDEVPPAQVERVQSGATAASVGRVARSAVGDVGQRQTRENSELSRPLQRISNRIQNRIQSRLRNRIDRNYDPQAQDPFAVAEERAVRARR